MRDAQTALERSDESPASPAALRGTALPRLEVSPKLDDAVLARQYPRPFGVILPVELRDVLTGPAPPPAGESSEARRASGRQVVRGMARVTYALPQHILDIKLPSPATVLERFVIDDRTRGVLERARPFPLRTTWTVAAYLDTPRFGPFCLVDLLAAHAESTTPIAARRGRDRSPNGRGGKRAPSSPLPAAPRLAAPARLSCALEELSPLLVRSMPLTGQQIGELLIRAWLSPQLRSVRDLERAYRSAGLACPFRLIRHGDAEVVVPPSVRAIAKAVLVAASQFVAWRGIATVREIAARAQLRAAALITELFAGRLLATLPGVVWLDQGREWFSFRDTKSPLLRAVRKALASEDRVELPSLRQSLPTGKELLSQLPVGAWERYLSVVGGYTIDGRWVLRGSLDVTPIDGVLCLV
jgi:hypothetical protein